MPAVAGVVQTLVPFEAAAQVGAVTEAALEVLNQVKVTQAAVVVELVLIQAITKVVQVGLEL